MNTSTLHASEPLPAPGRWWMVGAAVLGGLTLLAWLMGYGPGATACRAPALTTAQPAATSPAVAPQSSAPATVSAPVAAEPATPVSAEALPEPAVAAAAAVLPTPVSIHFDVGRATPPDDSSSRLLELVMYLQGNANARAVVSGFHDPTGNAARNAELAQQRAQSVAAMLAAGGIAPERIELRRPSETIGSGSSDEARRVEVSVD